MRQCCRYKSKKDTLANWLAQVMSEMVMPQYLVIKKFQAEMDELKTQILQAQARVVELQDELLKTKSEQLESVKTVVQTSVKEGIKSYSSALGSCMSAQSAPPQKMLQEVVNDVIQVEERNRNLVVFGLEEEVGENLEGKVGEVFQELGEKPHLVEVIRLGSATSGKTRPVKVTTSSRGVARNYERG